MGNWSKLKADEKVRVIKFARLNGVSDIKTIRDTFNMYADGGYNVNGVSLTYIRNGNIQPNYNVTSYAGNVNGNKIYTFNSDINGVTNSESTVVTPEFANVLLDDNARTFSVGTPEYSYYNDRVKALQSYNTSPGNILPEITVTPKENYKHTQYANGGNLTHKKSTGGPLYPFSFEKSPLLKTPVVRYDEGGEITNINLPEFTVMPRDSFVTYTGEETVAPTLELFIKSKQDEARVLAGHKMLDITMPLIPTIPSQSKISKILGKAGVSDENRIKLFGTWNSPGTCIYTATGLYPEENRVSGTKTFALKHRDYGFVPVENGLFGDIGLFNGHGTMITGFNHKRQPILSYSRGGLDTSHILIDNDNWDNPQGNHYLGSLGPMTSYRFVGTPELQREWANLYNTLYSK